MPPSICQPARLLILLVATLLAGCDVAPPAAQAPSPALATAPVASLQATTSPAPPTAAPPPSSTPAPTARPTASQPAPTDIPLTPTPTLAPLDAGQRRQIFGQIWRLVRDRYVYPDYNGQDWRAIRAELEPRALEASTPESFYEVLREMIERLGDDHSRFESPQEVAEQQARAEGELSYGGIGVDIRMQPDGALILRLAPGGPADQAGLRPRDMIVAIDGTAIVETAAFGPDGPSGAVRGAPGTTVRLAIRSPGGATREVELTRRAIGGDAFPPVEAIRLPGTQIGLLRLDTFERTDLAARARGQIESLLAGGPLDGLIVDVRENGGGYVEAMLDTLALFVDGGTIGTSQSRTRADKLTIPRGQTIAQLDGVPMAVLIGDESVSAAEMFAAGMQVTGRARIVGVPTAGNLENLLLHSFSDGSQLWLAEITYHLPDGETLEGRGVQPDRRVDAEWWNFDPPDDPQVKAAIEELR